MRVAVFRTADDGHRTALRLAELGHEAVMAPVIETVPTGCALPDLRPDAVVFTSGHGVDAVTADRGLARLFSTPCYCVGSRTAAGAKALGFEDVRDGRADAERLAALIKTAVKPGAALLLICGRDRKPVIEDTLTAHGYAVTAVEVYRAASVPRWPQNLVAALADQQTLAALHYSRRSAELARDQARAAGLSDAFVGFRHYCLSEDAAAPLRQMGAPSVMVADHPDEKTLLALIERTARRSSVTACHARGPQSGGKSTPECPFESRLQPIHSEIQCPNRHQIPPRM